MLRSVVVSVMFLCFGWGAGAETQGASHDWQRVEQLKAGTSIHLKTMSKKSLTCKVSSVTDAELVCLHGKSSKEFPRSEVRSIKLEHRARSALVGLAVGAGVGAGIGAAVGHAEDSNGWFSGLVTGAGALLGGVIGGIAGLAVGAPADMTAGAPIYQAP